ncbi:MAG: Phage protein [Candidatus Carbobacillus altaicus]|uniref:receptor protein-tyrosine kinase n=1 Tax=Candidatus Carbonibacillus altaicus TaxID=2163959 RepID=A0A2R6XXY8_9BACL|nr:MAG: Phage protein [Candidatus Carbobacillus altaicus]
MNKKGSTTLQYVIIFFVTALILTSIYQTWYFARVRSVVLNAAHEASKTYAQNAEAYNAVNIAKQAATNVVSSNLPIGRVKGTYNVDNIPLDWVKGVVQKSGVNNYAIGMVNGTPISATVKEQLDQNIGKEVAVKAEDITDESKKNSFVQASNNNFNNTSLYGTTTDFAQKTGESIYGTVTGSSNGSYYVEKAFEFTGTKQEFVAPVSGTYLLEVNGAQGGSSSGGRGGYARGEVYLNAGEKVYIYVGGLNGYNGGAVGKFKWYGTGGGATHIAKRDGLLKDLENYKNDVLIVAGGGGGAASYKGLDVYEISTNSYTGQSATKYSGGKGGIDDRGTPPGEDGTFGQGGSSSVYREGGGGGGWYGGGGGGHHNDEAMQGGAGSNYIGGVSNGYEAPGGVNLGNGKAKITLVKRIENGENKVIRSEYTCTKQDSVPFVAPKTGKYLLEVWGAASANGNMMGPNGGYSRGEIYLQSGETIYVTVGCASTENGKGGFNGGGPSYFSYNSGGGATHIAKRKGLLKSLENYKNDVLIVAGGASGGDKNYALRSEGQGGGLSGTALPFNQNSEPGTQTSGGVISDRYLLLNGRFGEGGGIGDVRKGGGGGWYGGSAGEYFVGGGGSGYIGGVQNGTTITGGNTRSKDGSAVITYIDKNIAVEFYTNNTFPSVFEQNETKSLYFTVINPPSGIKWEDNTKLQVTWYDVNNNVVNIDEYPIGTTYPDRSRTLWISITAPSNVGQYKVVYSLVSGNEKAEQTQTFSPVKVIQKSVYLTWSSNNTIPSPLERKNPVNVHVTFQNKDSTPWSPANTSIIVEWKNQNTYITKTYPISQTVAPGGTLNMSISMPPDDIPIGTYEVTYKLISGGIEGSQIQTFSNVKVENKIHLDLLEGGINNKVPAFVETGKTIQAQLQFQRTDNRNDIPLKEGNIVYQWRIGGQVRYEYPLKLGGKGTLYAGESFYENVPIQSPPVQGVYDLVILAKPITGNPIFTSTEIIFKDIYVGVEPKQTVITGVMDVNDKTVNVDTPLLTVNIKPNGDTVTSEVIYHAPLVWNFGKFMSGINKPIFDIKGESVMRIEKPLFEAERK